MAKTYKLTDLLVKSLKPRNKAYVTSDGKGLNIKVYPNGRKQWILRKSSGGKAHYIYLGTYPELSIKDARALAASQAAALPDTRQAAQPNQVMTVRELAEDWLQTKNYRASSVANFYRCLQHLAPFHNRTIDNVTPLEARRLAIELGHSSGSSTPGPVMSLLASLEKHAYALGLVDTARLTLLPSTIKKHVKTNFRSVSANRLPELFEVMSDNLGRNPETNLTYVLSLMLTLGRTQEVASMHRDWIDSEQGLIVFPADIMKANREHRTPVCTQLQNLLASEYVSESGYVLAGAGGAGTHFNPRSFNAVFVRLGINELICPHGVRSMARSWFAEQGFDFSAAEMCLAHRVENMTQRAYQRTDYINQRRTIMQAWGDYVESCMSKHLAGYLSLIRPPAAHSDARLAV